jgi:hypothetical protein
MVYPRTRVFKGGIELAALLTLLWLLYLIGIPSHVAALDEVGMCISAADHQLRIREIRPQEKTRNTSVVVEEVFNSRKVLVVILEGTGSSNAHGLYYMNWRGELHVWSWKAVSDC